MGVIVILFSFSALASASGLLPQAGSHRTASNTHCPWIDPALNFLLNLATPCLVIETPQSFPGEVRGCSVQSRFSLKPFS